MGRDSARARSPCSPSWRRPTVPIRTPELADRHGDGTLRGLVRRGLVEVATTVAERRPLEGRAVGRARRPTRRLHVHPAPGRGDRPHSAGDRGPRPDAAAARRRDRRAARRRSTSRPSPRPWRPAGRRSSSCRRSRSPCRSSTGCGSTSTPRSPSSIGASGKASGPTSGGASGPRRAPSRRGHAPGRPGAARRPGRRHRRRGARRRVQVRTGRRASRRATAAIELGRLAGAAVVLGSATPDVSTRSAGRGPAVPAGARCRPVPAAPADRRGRRPAGRARGRQPRPPLGRARGRPRRARPGDGRAGDPGHQPARRRVAWSSAATAATCRSARSASAPLVFHAGRHDAALPSLRRDGAAGDALPGLRLAAHPLPGRRHGARRARGPRPLPAAARRPPRPRRRGAPRRGRAGPRRVRDGGLDVLVGTSLVAKGLDVPEVTLVGVVSADIALNLPDERAAERTYQLLAQAVGRAGRGERPGRAIIQTYQPDHPAIAAVGDAAMPPPSTTPSWRTPRALRLAAVRRGCVKLTVGARAERRRGRARRRAPWPTACATAHAPGAGRHGRGARARLPAYVARRRRAVALPRRPARAATRRRCSAATRARRGRSTSTPKSLL